MLGIDLCQLTVPQWASPKIFPCLLQVIPSKNHNGESDWDLTYFTQQYKKIACWGAKVQLCDFTELFIIVL